MYKNTAPIARGCRRGGGSRHRHELGHALLADLHQLTGLDSRVQERADLLGAEALELGHSLEDLGHGHGVGIGLDRRHRHRAEGLVLALGLGGLVGLGGVALLHLLTQGGQLLGHIGGQVGNVGQDVGQSGGVSHLGHGINPFSVCGVRLPFTS